MLYVFGDSWGYGSELDENEKPFGYYLSVKLNQDYTNYSKPGASLGHITGLVISNADSIKQDDHVVIVIPPDIRWYLIDDDFQFKSLSLSNDDYKKLLRHYNESWFVYHHNLFIYTIITTILTKTSNLVLCHNYGKLVIHEWFKNLIDTKYFLSNKSLTELLLGNLWEDNYSLDFDGPTTDVFQGKYFEGKISHPNLKGHLEITRLIYEKFNEK